MAPSETARRGVGFLRPLLACAVALCGALASREAGAQELRRVLVQFDAELGPATVQLRGPRGMLTRETPFEVELEPGWYDALVQGSPRISAQLSVPRWRPRGVDNPVAHYLVRRPVFGGQFVGAFIVAISGSLGVVATVGLAVLPASAIPFCWSIGFTGTSSCRSGTPEGTAFLALQIVTPILMALGLPVWIGHVGRVLGPSWREFSVARLQLSPGGVELRW